MKLKKMKAGKKEKKDGERGEAVREETSIGLKDCK